MSTAAPIATRAYRTQRRSYLTGILAQVTRELLELERAERRIPVIAEAILEQYATANPDDPQDPTP